MRNPTALLFLVLPSLAASAQMPALLDRPTAAAFAQELSGATAKRNLELISTNHRMRGSSGFHGAAEHIAAQLRSYGIAGVEIEKLPADGKIFYGTQRSRPAWDARFAELWELRDGRHLQRLASWEAVPLSLAQDSESGEAEAGLVDVGPGTTEADYAGKNVQGSFVLTSAQPGSMAELALKHGAVGIVSHAQNQRTAWSGDNPDQVRWGHLDTFARQKTFAFMISLRQARALQQKLMRGEPVRLHGVVRAGQHPGTYDVVNASIPGADPKLRREEIVFTCHLDHPRPGANDNASGCAAILEVARTVHKLIGEKKIAPPARTLRFLWPLEVEGSMAMLGAHPEWAANQIKANIHLDMVGGGMETETVFHVTRGPASVPSFIDDVAEDIAGFVNQETWRFAASGEAEFPLHAEDGGKGPLRADLARFTMGSDHEVFADSSWGIPTIYLNDWPDRNIHTNFDTAAMIDSTKLERAAFIAGTAGYVLANAGAAKADALAALVTERGLARLSDTVRRGRELSPAEQANLGRVGLAYERAVFDSMARFFPVPEAAARSHQAFLAALAPLFPALPAESKPGGEAAARFQRKAAIKGPMSVFGYDYFDDHYGRERAEEIRLLGYQGSWGGGGEYAYEALNFADGKSSVQEIRDRLSAEYGPVPLPDVLQYLQALESIGVVERLK